MEVDLDATIEKMVRQIAEYTNYSVDEVVEEFVSEDLPVQNQHAVVAQKLLLKYGDQLEVEEGVEL